MSFSRLSPSWEARREIWQKYRVALGLDGSIIDEDQKVFVVYPGDALEVAVVDYPHGWHTMFRSTMIQTIGDEHDLRTQFLVAADRGFVAQRFIHLVRLCRIFLRKRRMKRLIKFLRTGLSRRPLLAHEKLFQDIAEFLR